MAIRFWESCQTCWEPMRMSGMKAAQCPKCGATVLPCSKCRASDCSSCPYAKKAPKSSRRCADVAE